MIEGQKRWGRKRGGGKFRSTPTRMLFFYLDNNGKKDLTKEEREEGGDVGEVWWKLFLLF